jgi:general secretion pathway protein I
MTTPADRRTAMAGFSLIELLVALAVFALVVVGLLNLAGESTRTAVHLEERVLAGIVADNQAVESMLVEPAALSTPTGGVDQLGGRQWRWRRVATSTGEDGLLRIDITVDSDAGQQAASAWVFR